MTVLDDWVSPSIQNDCWRGRGRANASRPCPGRRGAAGAKDDHPHEARVRTPLPLRLLPKRAVARRCECKGARRQGTGGNEPQGHFLWSRCGVGGGDSCGEGRCVGGWVGGCGWVVRLVVLRVRLWGFRGTGGWEARVAAQSVVARREGNTISRHALTYGGKAWLTGRCADAVAGT